MNIKDLIEVLKKYPDNMQVFLASDPEGNEFRGVGDMYVEERQKSHSDGTFDALSIFPNDELYD